MESEISHSFIFKLGGHSSFRQGVMAFFQNYVFLRQWRDQHFSNYLTSKSNLQSLSKFIELKTYQFGENSHPITQLRYH